MTFLGYAFVEYPNKNCLVYQNLHETPGGSANEIEACKEWCVGNQICSAFVVWSSRCYFRGPGCKDDLHQSLSSTVYLMETTQQ